MGRCILSKTSFMMYCNFYKSSLKSTFSKYSFWMEEGVTKKYAV